MARKPLGESDTLVADSWRTMPEPQRCSSFLIGEKCAI